MDIMTWNKYKDDIRVFNSYIQDIDSSEIYDGSNNNFERLVTQFDNLFDFIIDNDQIFTNYINKSDNEKYIYPFDMICKNILDKFEVFFQYLISNLFNKLNMIDEVHFLTSVNDLLKNRRYIFTNFIEELDTIISDKIITAFTILKKLSNYNKTLIILGANGSGKTSFANFLRNTDNNIKVIPASKPIKLRGSIPHLYNSNIDNSCNEILSKNDLEEDLLQKLIIGICSEHDEVSRICYDTGEKKESKFIKIKKIFEDFFDIELDHSQFSNKKIMAKKKGYEDKFAFNNMSDGERVAFFYIATTIVAPPKSFIVVDEPENHLNPAIYNKIWDRLINERSDCQFIFISHTIEFINARAGFELVTINNFCYPDKFEFEFFGDSLEDINQDFLVEIIGSRKPILFCEGIRSSYDYKIYEILFCNKYTIIPTENCTSVISNVTACNKHANLYNIQNAIGIIDSDLKNQDEIDYLKNRYIYTLKCNDIEMILIDENIFKKVLTHTFKNENNFNIFKDKFFKKLTERKDFIIKRIIKTIVDDELHHSVIDDKLNKSREELKEDFKNIFDRIRIDDLWDTYDRKLSEIIDNKNYDAAIQCCCLEHNEIINGVCNNLVKDYANFAIGVLAKDSSLRNIIKEKYFGYYGL